MSKQFADVEVAPINAPWALVAGNFIYAMDHAVGRLRALSRLRENQRYFTLTRSTILPSAATVSRHFDLVFAHESYPLNGEHCSIPIVVQTRLASDQCRAAYGLDARYARREFLVKESWARRATYLLLPTPGDERRYCERYPAFADKCVMIPTYMPWIEPTEEKEISEKHATTDVIRILFVGNEARRKGIDQIIQAWRRLPGPIAGRISMTVVSRFLDGVPDVDGLPWRVISDISQSEMERLLSTSHALLLPTHGDTFGVALIEGMAAGCCVISSQRCPQDWILNYGQAGILVDPTSSEAIRIALETLVNCPAIRRSLALAGNRRFRDVFFHRVIGAQYHQLFQRAIRSVGRLNQHGRN